MAVSPWPRHAASFSLRGLAWGEPGERSSAVLGQGATSCAPGNGSAPAFEGRPWLGLHSRGLLDLRPCQQPSSGRFSQRYPGQWVLSPPLLPAEAKCAS